MTTQRVVFFNTTATWLEMMVRVYGVVMMTGCWGVEDGWKTTTYEMMADFKMIQKRRCENTVKTEGDKSQKKETKKRKSKSPVLVIGV